MSEIKVAIKPGKPWGATPRERAFDLGAILLAALGSFALVAMSELKGKLAYAGVFFILIIMINFIHNYFTIRYY